METLADVLAVRVAWNPPTVHRIKRKRPVLEGFDSPTPDSPISHAAGVFPLGGKESAAIYGAPTNGGDNAPLHRGDMQQLAIGILGRVALAIAAVLELPGRAFSPSHKPALHDDIEELVAFFVKAMLMEETLVRQSVMFLFLLTDSRCDGE